MAAWQHPLGSPTLLEFCGPDAIRFLNGQLTQNVKKVTGSGKSLSSCVTDAKGKLQFRIDLTEGLNNALWVSGFGIDVESLEARLTRYLIADDVEVQDLTGRYDLVHLANSEIEAPEGVIVRENLRYGFPGMDWWIPTGLDLEIDLPIVDPEVLEAMRIQNGIPVWGRELTEGMLPPEAGLDLTDISYHKGCYIGQEVISRIKSAGKVNKKLTRFLLDSEVAVQPGDSLLSEESAAGEITSVSPKNVDGSRLALGYLKRGKETGSLTVRISTGEIFPIRVA